MTTPSLPSLDLTAVEARVIAFMGATGDDPYTLKAAELYGIPTADVTPEQRRIAKHENTRLAYSGTGRRPTEPEQQDMPQ